MHVVLFHYWGSGQVIGETPWYIPTMHSFAGLAAFSVAFVALGRYQVLRDPASYWIGMGFAAFGIQSIFFILVWPGLLPGGQGVIARLPNTSGWIAVFELATIGLFLLAAALAHWPAGQALAGRRWLWLAAAWLLFVVLVCLLLVSFEQYLPALIGPAGGLGPLLLAFDWAFLALFAAGTALSTRRYLRTGDTLLGYVALTQIALAFTIITALVGGKRYDVWYYLSRILIVGGFLSLLFGLLSEYVGLFRREQEKTHDLRAANEEIRKLNEGLEQRIRERTAALEATNKELEAFSYSVSHDLRAPLRHIDGFGSMLASRYAAALDAEGQDYLNRIRGAAQRMAQLIDDLLGLSRAGRAEMHRQPIDLSAAAQEILADLQRSQPDRQAELAVAPGVVADGDPRLLRIVLENLLGNAWKFTGKRPVARIEFGVSQQDGARVYCIRDNGAGFDPARAGKLFTPFERLHAESQFSGIGIGLALVQRIVHRHGGRVWAEGEVDRGATFCFTLGEGLAADEPPLEV